MSDPVRFLTSLAHALAVMRLYPDEHPARVRAADVPYEVLEGLMKEDPAPSFTFLEDEVLFGREALRDMRQWSWGRRLVKAGLQRLEFERRIDRQEFDGFLDEIVIRLTGHRGDTSENRQLRSTGVRFGSVVVQGAAAAADPVPADLPELPLSLSDEAETVRWLQREIQTGSAIPILEAESVVRSLSVAMHGHQQLVVPLLRIKEFDQYTTTHSLNVAVLSMALAEALGCSPKAVRAYGIAGLLHDIGKVRIPIEVLTKPGLLSADERAMMHRHPVDGARLIVESEDDLEMAAVVAYEHHIMLNGHGYPSLRFSRECTLASRLVHVCDVYDALSTQRPYRDGWPPDAIATYLEERAGIEFDPDLVHAFLRTLREGDVQVRVLHEEI
jgi:putative nucleotidyltransferase with HDIG domain